MTIVPVLPITESYNVPLHKARILLLEKSEPLQGVATFYCIFKMNVGG